MRVHTPSSIVRVVRRIRLYDAIVAVAAAPVAFLFRDQFAVPPDRLFASVNYCKTAAIVGLVFVTVFHIGKAIRGFFSSSDLFLVVQASLATAATTAFVSFSLTRLEFIPRSIPLSHFLLMISLLLLGRLIEAKRREAKETKRHKRAPSRHVLILGANRLALFYTRMVDDIATESASIVGILDDNDGVQNHALNGYPVLGTTADLPRVLSEYAVHGVKIDQVIVAQQSIREWGPRLRIERICRENTVEVFYLGEFLGLDSESFVPPIDFESETEPRPERAYLIFKRGIDLIISAAVLVLTLPLVVLVVVGVLIDVGWPVLFWQKRLGRFGGSILVYKFRTLRAPFDRNGYTIVEARRLSRFGFFLRRSRLDEWPQLWNIFVGNMSFVGPRPLLPEDQPEASRLRLSVLPGITGWAQIHGGQSVEVEAKGAFDDWYVNNISLMLDIQILLRTLLIVLFGGNRADDPLHQSRPRSDLVT